MDIDGAAITNAYLEHFSAGDRALLFGEETGGLSRPGQLESSLSGSRVFEAVFGRGGEEGAGGAAGPLLGASPFLVFAVAVHRATTDLASATHVSEWLGPRRRAPVFDVAPLRDFLSAPWRRLFLAELLASYTHVASGSVMVATRRGWRRQRFSELDPVRLAGLLEVVSEAERPGILRRLGDLALFLTGVFPDYVARRGFGPVEEGRLLRAGGLPRGRSAGSAGWAASPESFGLGDTGAVGLLEQLGRRWYRAASELVVPPVPVSVAVLGELPERFSQARRILNMVTDRFLFASRDQWFGFGG